jgi:hypothetical protein
VGEGVGVGVGLGGGLTAAPVIGLVQALSISASAVSARETRRISTGDSTGAR